MDLRFQGTLLEICMFFISIEPTLNTSDWSIISSLCCREKKVSRTSALKVLDHGMIGPEGADNCHKFVDILGLRTIFPLFMKTPKKMKKTGTSEKEHEGQWLIRKQQQQMRSLHTGCNQLHPVLACWVVWLKAAVRYVIPLFVIEMQSAVNSVSKLFA